jgi:hypothetical protein
VLLAAAKAAGIDVTDPSSGAFVGRLPAQIDDLPEDVQESLLRHIWALINTTEKTLTNPDERR